MAYELQCPHCLTIFRTNPKLIYSETSNRLDDMTRQDVLNVDCPECNTHILVHATWILDTIVCRYETASESKSLYSHIDHTSDRKYNWEEME